ncbi:hypothetical protein LJC13_02235, partial [Peptostreptococcaceae bacterium OttesenSCG-928-C18]|nr:hypothetical protein [Peptostreptococcaceae bacterium OttesenSCG-928-C18]
MFYLASQGKNEKNSNNKSFIGKLIDDLDIKEKDSSGLQRRKSNPNIVKYDWDDDNPLSGRRVLVTKKNESLRKNDEDSGLEEKVHNKEETVSNDNSEVKRKEFSKEDVIKDSAIEREELDISDYEPTTLEETEEVVEKESRTEENLEQEKEESNVSKKREPKAKGDLTKKSRVSIYWRRLKRLLADDKKSKYKNQNNEKGPSRKLLLVVLSILCIVVLSLVAILAIEGESFAIDNVSTDFMMLLEEGNVDKVKSSVVFEGENTKDFENSIPNFIQLCKEDEEFKAYVKSSIEADVKSIKKDENFKTGTLVGVVESGKHNLFFPGYKVKISPLVVSSESMVDKFIKIGDKKQDIKENTYVIPGIYHIITEFEFLKLSNSATIKYENNEAVSSINVDYSESKISNEHFEL